jgi:beta-galactosidase
MGAMGMIDYYRLPLNAWHWYRQELLGIPKPPSKRLGVPFALRLRTSAEEIKANGQEDAHLIIEIVGEDGISLANELPVTLTVLEGDGIFPTGKRIVFTPENKSFLYGEAAIEFRSYYGGENIIEASAEGVQPCRIHIIARGEPLKRALVPMTPPPYLTPAPSFQMRFNLSVNKPVFASSVREGYDAANVTLSDDSYWMPQDEDDPWLMLDLEGTRTIHGIEVFLIGDQRASCCVQLSKDDGSHVEQFLPAAEQGYAAEGEWSFRYIKMHLKKGIVGIREIRLWLKQ